MSETGTLPSSLRERKKAKTRAAIQQHALRLFREQGYDETTVGQIAEAAEVSESTFFRYFPTKEDVVIWDRFDPLLIEAFRSQPPDVSAIGALRAAFKEAFGDLPDEEVHDLRIRTALILSVPELRSASLDQFVDMLPLVSEILAERAGRSPDDLEVRTLAGTMIGVAFSVMLSSGSDPVRDWLPMMDEALALLEAGLRL